MVRAVLSDVTGFRGEKIVELCLTDYTAFESPLFQPAFLGEKWPTTDFLVELAGVPRKKPFFFCQVKSTTSNALGAKGGVKIACSKRDVLQLLQLPGPTYVFGVHEPSRRVFVRSIHQGVVAGAITRIDSRNELTAANLRLLYNEVRDYWAAVAHKPVNSVFS